MPAFLILICGFPTFHWMDTINIFCISCDATGFSYYFIADKFSINSIKTKVSILTSRSLCGFIMYSKTLNIYGKNLITSLWQLRTIVSNLNRSLEVLVQLTYYFFYTNFFKIGSTWSPWSYAILLNPAFLANNSIILLAPNLTS